MFCKRQEEEAIENACGSFKTWAKAHNKENTEASVTIRLLIFVEFAQKFSSKQCYDSRFQNTDQLLLTPHKKE